MNTLPEAFARIKVAVEKYGMKREYKVSEEVATWGQLTKFSVVIVPPEGVPGKPIVGFGALLEPVLSEALRRLHEEFLATLPPDSYSTDVAAKGPQTAPDPAPMP